MNTLSADVLKARLAELTERHEKLSVDLIALAGAIQVLSELLAELEPSADGALTLDDLKRAGNFRSVEVVKNED